MTHIQPPPQVPPPGWEQPKKQRHTVRNVLLIVTGIIALFVVGCVALIGQGVNDALNEDAGSTSTGASSRTTKAIQDRGQPRPVTVGKAFTIGKHRMDAGWKVEYDQFLGTKVTGSVTNVSQDTSTAFFHIKFLKGNRVVANAQCSTNDLEPGQSEDIECFDTVAGSKKVTYDRVTAEATF